MKTKNLRTLIRKIILENWDTASPEDIAKFNREYMARPVNPNEPSYIVWTDSKNYREEDYLEHREEDRWPHPYYIGGKGQTHWLIRAKKTDHRGRTEKEDYWCKDCTKSQARGILQAMKKKELKDHLEGLELNADQIIRYKQAVKRAKKAKTREEKDALYHNSLSKYSNYDTATRIQDLDFARMSTVEILEAVPAFPIKYHIRGPFTTESITMHIRDNLAGHTQEVEFTHKKKPGGTGKWWQKKKK